MKRRGEEEVHYMNEVMWTPQTLAILSVLHLDKVPAPGEIFRASGCGWWGWEPVVVDTWGGGVGKQEASKVVCNLDTGDW